MTEREFKLLVDSDVSALVLDLLLEESRTVVLSRETRIQADRYFDTKALALARSGAALRVRVHAEDAKICWKGRGRVQGALHEREELELPWPSGAEPKRAAELPPSLRVRVEPFTLCEKLRNVLEIRTTRHVRRCAAPDGRETFEVVLDEVAASDHKAGSTDFREVEIEGELPEGGLAHRFHDLVTHRAAARPSTQSKLERALAGCGIRVPAVATELLLPAGEARAGVAARDLLLACAHQIAQQEALVRRVTDAEPVHRMRVACRKLRSALRLFADLYAKRQREPVERAVQELGRALGKVRDLDVRLAELAELDPELPPPIRASMLGVRTALEVLRAEELAKLRVWLASDARLQSAERAAARLEERPDGPRADAELLPFLTARVAKLAADVFTRGDAIAKDTAPEELHDLRIAVKRLRYALEFGESHFGERHRELAKHAAKVQTLLGTYNDAITAQVHLPEVLTLQGEEDLALAHALALQRRAGRKARERFAAGWPDFASEANRELLRS